jgi:hypothetical protein
VGKITYHDFYFKFSDIACSFQTLTVLLAATMINGQIVEHTFMQVGLPVDSNAPWQVDCSNLNRMVLHGRDEIINKNGVIN